MKRIIGSFLLILMLIPLFLACNQKPGGTDTSDDTTAAEETDRVGSLPPMSFNGDTVTILFWSDHQLKQEFDVWERDGEKVNDAVYLRNINTEAYLDVELDFIGEPGNNVNIQGFLSRAFIDAMSEQVIDIYATYTRTVGSLAAQGLCIDLLPLDHLDFDMPWWPSKLVEVSTAKEKLFFVSGDISTNMIYMMYGIFFNKELMTDFDFEMPYDLVHEGKWTLDTMIEMTRAVYNDLNGSNEKDKEDLFGMSMFNLHYDALFYGSGLRTIDKNEDDEFILSPTYTGEKMTNFLEKMCERGYGSKRDIRRGQITFLS